MDYIFKEYSIDEVIYLIENNKIDLNPSYQRNFIWSPDNQMELIDTILKAYPLPSFFFYEKSDGNYEMVDGQQRTKTIYRFYRNEITASRAFKKVRIGDIDKNQFLKYRIPVILIKTLSNPNLLKEFYVLINKKGVHLNPAEVAKSEFLDTNFMKLANELLTYQNLINLNLFTEATSKRMNDRAFVEELLAFLVSGIRDKRKSVENVYKTDIDGQEYDYLRTSFMNIIDKIDSLNKFKPLAETRYRQKNDFYTLFSFVSENIESGDELLLYQYRILLLIDGKDSEGRQLIRPSNEECVSLREYANNCITQSNSKTAREKRLYFFNAMLKNESISINETLADVLNYLSKIFGNRKINLKKVKNYELLDVDSVRS